MLLINSAMLISKRNDLLFNYSYQSLKHGRTHFKTAETATNRPNYIYSKPLQETQPVVIK